MEEILFDSYIKHFIFKTKSEKDIPENKEDYQKDKHIKNKTKSEKDIPENKENYQKDKHNNKKNKLFIYFKLLCDTYPISTMIPTFIFIVFGVTYAVLCNFDFFKPYIVWGVLVLVVLAVFISCGFHKHFLLSSDDRLNSYCAHIIEVKKWLDEKGFLVTAENVSVLISRVQKNIEDIEKKQEKNVDRITKWMQILLIPLLLIIYTEFIGQGRDVVQILANGLYSFIFTAFLFLVALAWYYILTNFLKMKLEQMKCFAADLQAILDCQIGDKLLIKPMDKLEIPKEENKIIE